MEEFFVGRRYEEMVDPNGPPPPAGPWGLVVMYRRGHHWDYNAGELLRFGLDEPLGDFAGQLAYVADSGPHDPELPEFLLEYPFAPPADPERRAEWLANRGEYRAALVRICGPEAVSALWAAHGWPDST